MDLVRMKELLSQYMPGHAIYMVKCDIADRYYRNQSDVLYGPKKEDEEGHPLRNADNRIPRNFQLTRKQLMHSLHRLRLMLVIQRLMQKY